MHTPAHPGRWHGPPRDGESWQEWLTRRARAYRAAVLAHRDGARLVATASWLSPATIRTFDQELTAMVERGFTPALALQTIAAISRYVTGFVLQEQRTRMMSDGTALDDPLEAVASCLIEVPKPRCCKPSGTAGSPLGAAAFDHGLRTIIAGTAVVLDAQPR